MTQEKGPKKITPKLGEKQKDIFDRGAPAYRGSGGGKKKKKHKGKGTYRKKSAFPSRAKTRAGSGKYADD